MHRRRHRPHPALHLIARTAAQLEAAPSARSGPGGRHRPGGGHTNRCIRVTPAGVRRRRGRAGRRRRARVQLRAQVSPPVENSPPGNPPVPLPVPGLTPPVEGLRGGGGGAVRCGCAGTGRGGRGRTRGAAGARRRADVVEPRDVRAGAEAAGDDDPAERAGLPARCERVPVARRARRDRVRRRSAPPARERDAGSAPDLRRGLRSGRRAAPKSPPSATAPCDSAADEGGAGGGGVSRGAYTSANAPAAATVSDMRMSGTTMRRPRNLPVVAPARAFLVRRGGVLRGIASATRARAGRAAGSACGVNAPAGTGLLSSRRSACS